MSMIKAAAAFNRRKSLREGHIQLGIFHLDGNHTHGKNGREGDLELSN